MKHKFMDTLQLLMWCVTCIFIGILLAGPLEKLQPSASSEVNPYVLAAVIVGFILLGAVFWTYAMKRFQPKWIDAGFALVVSYAVVDALYRLVLTETILYRVFALVPFTVIFLTIIYGAKMMRKSWKSAFVLMPFINSIMIVFFAIVAARIGNMLTPLVALLALGGAAVYDMWAVWRSKKMIKMANYFVERRIFPMIAVPTAKEGRFALLGGGDLFFIIIVAVSFMKTSPFISALTTIGMTASVVGLFLFAKKGRMYPALPYILVGAVAAIVIGLAIL